MREKNGPTLTDASRTKFKTAGWLQKIENKLYNQLVPYKGGKGGERGRGRKGVAEEVVKDNHQSPRLNV